MREAGIVGPVSNSNEYDEVDENKWNLCVAWSGGPQELHVRPEGRSREALFVVYQKGKSLGRSYCQLGNVTDNFTVYDRTDCF